MGRMMALATTARGGRGRGGATARRVGTLTRFGVCDDATSSPALGPTASSSVGAGDVAATLSSSPALAAVRVTRKGSIRMVAWWIDFRKKIFFFFEK
jgi:hypothetical protein